MLILFNKPFNVLCQFTGEPGKETLAGFIQVPGVYAAGRLDADTEGLLVLTDDGALQKRIADPRHKLPKTYLVQVEGCPNEAALARLRAGVDLGDFVTQPCDARLVAEPAWLWPRNPPIRERKSIPVSWVEIVLRAADDRQGRFSGVAAAPRAHRRVDAGRVGAGGVDGSGGARGAKRSAEPDAFPCRQIFPAALNAAWPKSSRFRVLT